MTSKGYGTERGNMRRQVAIFAGTRFVGSLLQAGLVILFARAVSPEVFGTITVLTTIAFMVMVFADFGVSNLLSKTRATGDDGTVLVGLKWSLLSVSASLLVLIGPSVYWATSIQDALTYGVLLVAVALEKFVETALAVAITDGESRVAAVSILLRRVLALPIFMSGIYFGLPAAPVYAVALTLSSATAFMHIAAYLKRNVSLQVGGPPYRHYPSERISAVLGQRISDGANGTSAINRMGLRGICSWPLLRGY